VTNFVDRLRQKLSFTGRDRAMGEGMRQKSSQFIFEPLEPRVLLSADPVVGAAAVIEPVVIAATEPTAITVGLLSGNSNAPNLAVQQEPSETGRAPAEQIRSRHEIVFVDTRVDNYEQLLDDFRSQSSDERRIEVRILDAAHDGIEQITQALAGFSGLDTVHLVSHGADGAVQLGSTWLDRDALQAMADSIVRWRASLSGQADLLLYGCELAASHAGVAFIEQLSLLTGADVAASVNRTGAKDLGADWVLEHSVGQIEAVAAASASLQNSWSGVLVAPAASNMNTAETYTLNTPLNLADIVISDVDSANVTARLTLSDPLAGSLSTGTSGAVISAYNAVTGVWTASGAIADVNALLANLTYTPSPLYLWPFSIATSVDDGVAPPITGSKSMTVGLINLPPSATNLNAPESYTENTPLDLTNIVISDLDSPNVTASLTLSNPTAGTLSTATSGSVTSTYDSVTGVWRASGAKGDVNALLAGLTFNPAPNHNGNFTIATSVDDGVAPAITGVKNVTGIPVNDAPTASNLNTPETYTLNTALNLADIVVSDVDSANVTVTLTLSDPAAGSLSTGTSGAVTSTYSAASGLWTASGAIADVNALLANLTYTPSLLYLLPFSIATSVDDGVAPAITGSKSMTMGLINLPPSASNLNAPESYTENTPLNLTDIAVSDIDSPNVTVTLTLSDTSAGVLSTAVSGSVTSTYNAATGVWSASGAIGDVNALLANVTFTPAANYNGNFTIATSVADGVAPPITGMKNVTGIPVNDAPMLVNNTLSISEGGSVVLSSSQISATDVDNASGSLIFVISNVSGGQFELAASPGVAITNFTQAQVSGGAVRFVHDGGETAPAFDVSVSDGSLSDGPEAATINFSNANDAPVLRNNHLIIAQGGSVVLSSANVSASDVDNASAGLTFIVSNVSGGHFELIAAPGIAITSFTQAQVTAGAVRFVHDGGAAGPRYNVTVSDGVLTDGPVAATITFNALGENGEPVPLSPPPETIPPVSPVEEPISGPVQGPTDSPSSTPAGGGGPDVTPSFSPSDPFGNEVQDPVDAPDVRDAAIVNATLSRIFPRPTNENRDMTSLLSEGSLVTPSSEPEKSATDRLTGGDLSPLVDGSSFVQELDKLREAIGEQTYLEKLVVGSTLTATTGLSIGYVLWLIRGQVLLTSLLASLPAWRLIDPLPVLSFLNKPPGEDEDDDSLEATVKKSAETPPPMPISGQRNSTKSVKWRIVMQPENAAENSL
jgi:hypothetical protein